MTISVTPNLAEVTCSSPSAAEGLRHIARLQTFLIKGKIFSFSFRVSAYSSLSSVRGYKNPHPHTHSRTSRTRGQPQTATREPTCSQTTGTRNTGSRRARTNAQARHAWGSASRAREPEISVWIIGALVNRASERIGCRSLGICPTDLAKLTCRLRSNSYQSYRSKSNLFYRLCRPVTNVNYHLSQAVGTTSCIYCPYCDMKRLKVLVSRPGGTGLGSR